MHDRIVFRSIISRSSCCQKCRVALLMLRLVVALSFFHRLRSSVVGTVPVVIIFKISECIWAEAANAAFAAAVYVGGSEPWASLSGIRLAGRMPVIREGGYRYNEQLAGKW